MTTVADVRNGLDAGGPGIDDATIKRFINVSRARVALKAGETQAETEIGQEIIRLSATSKALSIMARQSGRTVPDDVALMAAEAKETLELLDTETYDVTEAGGVNENAVEPLYDLSDPEWEYGLWNAAEFDIRPAPGTNPLRLRQ